MLSVRYEVIPNKFTYNKYMHISGETFLNYEHGKTDTDNCVM